MAQTVGDNQTHLAATLEAEPGIARNLFTGHGLQDRSDCGCGSTWPLDASDDHGSFLGLSVNIELMCLADDSAEPGAGRFSARVAVCNTSSNVRHARAAINGQDLNSRLGV